VIKEPKQRSARWISTSIPQKDWDSPLALYSSAEYHCNNLVSPVLFQEGLSLVPDNAVVVEIAPHALLQVSIHNVETHTNIGWPDKTVGFKTAPHTAHTGYRIVFTFI
jgi:fatty acid synthase